MAEPALRKLDQGLPRLDMYAPEFRARLLAKRAGIKEPRARPKVVEKPQPESAQGLIIAARQMLADAAADRELAAQALADARMQAATIIAEAEAMARIVSKTGPALPSVAAIQNAVADRYGITVSAMLGPGVSNNLVAARYEAIRQAHAARPDLSPARLGRLFRRDRTIIIRAIAGKGPKP
jgi:regulator of protease activity HflC (stomatin/prohibitin superfamily)